MSWIVCELRGCVSAHVMERCAMLEASRAVESASDARDRNHSGFNMLGCLLLIYNTDHLTK